MPRPRLPFTTVRTEGAILPADLLQRIADGDAGLGGLAPESYHLSGERLNEAINRAWNRLLGAWANFQAAAGKLPEADPGTTVTRERWLLPLFQELGYGRLIASKATEICSDTGAPRAYPISHNWSSVPIHLVGFRVDLDRRTAGVAGAARSSPHSLVQELLNRSEAHLWGFLSNGLQLRLLRDNASLTRQAYVEFDLEAMMAGEVYADFALLWLVCHQSRVEGERPAEFWLEKWSRAAQEQGTRALDQLRDGVQGAISALGRGFLAHRDNRALREKLTSGTLHSQDYYRQLLRLVYRLIFLFVADDRSLLLDPRADASAGERYTRFYSTARVRRLAERQRGTRHADLYHGLRLVFDKLGSETGCPELGLPALGGFLFSRESVPDVERCEIANHDLLDAVRSLAFTLEGRVRRAVDYRNLGPEELGSVYESLLELHPILSTDAATFELQQAGGSERKTTGSHYSPTGLIMRLIESALDPVIEQAVKRGGGKAEATERALLDLKVCDPACGSGHFLIAAAHRIARRLAAARSGEDEPSPEILRAALRDVIGRCLYGVDVNPMAVELCKFNLWLESLEPGKPLTFLDSRIKCGNSLIGIGPHPGPLSHGGRGDGELEIPDEAFEPVTGDHKPTAKALKKRNKAERAGQLSFTVTVLRSQEDLARWAAEQARRLGEMPEDTAAQVAAKADEYSRYRGSAEYAQQQLEADLWTAAFFWHIKEPASRDLEMLAPTHGELMRLRRGEPLNPELVRNVNRLAERERFLHWPVEFPAVFSPTASNEKDTEGGFDCVLGNPPWEMLQLDPQEYFGTSAPHISQAAHTTAREKLIAKLADEEPTLFAVYQADQHAIEAAQKFVHGSGRYPLTSYGRINLMALFAELARRSLSSTGRAGMILPTGIATDSFNRHFFADLIKMRSLASLYDFENREAIFPGVHRSYRFCLLTMSKALVKEANFAFFASRADQLDDGRRRFTLDLDEIALFNPNTCTMPVFRTRADAELTRIIYQSVPVLINEESGTNPWGFKGVLMFMMNTDSRLFVDKPASGLLPLYEAKLIHQFDHRWATYDGDDVRELTYAERCDPAFAVRPRYWIATQEVNRRLGDWMPNWLICFRDITNATNERTMIVSVLPVVGVGNNAPLILVNIENTRRVTSCFTAALNSLVFDYVVRQKIGGTHLNFFIVKQLPVLPPITYTSADVDFILPRVLELAYTAWDIKPFAEDMGYGGEPFRWDEDRRALLRAELDAYCARLYGLNRKQLRYILDPHGLSHRELEDILDPWEDPTCAGPHLLPEHPADDFPGETFRVLKEKEERLYGEYRTRRLVLEAWERLAQG